MVYQANIVSYRYNSDSNTYEIKVRVPTLHQSSGASGGVADSDLPTCTVNALPGMRPHYEQGDSVYVMFRDNNLDTPAIVGMAQNSGNKSRETDVNAKEFVAVSSAKLPVDTTLEVEDAPNGNGVPVSGTITKDNWKNLYKLTSPVQLTLDEHAGRLDYIESNPCYDMVRFMKAVIGVFESDDVKMFPSKDKK